MTAPTASPATAGEAPTRTVRVIGLDLSLTSSGVASSLGWTERIRPRQLRGLDRLRHIRQRVIDYAVGASLAVVEGPSYGHGRMAGHDEMAALRWMVRDDLTRAGLPVAIVPPSTLKLWATGNGRASKGDVAAAMDRVHPGLGLMAGQRYDEADAMALADMGHAWLTHRTGLTPTQQRAMDGAAWPDGAVTLR
ncbi:hypothetical protein [Nocardiopsis protaetiae]|uniref:hypothetical protein n=1 Tax=Nocardiopsis protaetiae TaxID=3382270 RepID=UPI00387AED5E